MARFLPGLLALLLVVLPSVGAPAAAADPQGDAPSRNGVVRPVDGAVIRAFDPPENPYGPGHRGVDLAADPGSGVRAPMAGHVAFAGRINHVGWVTLDHGGGLATTYGPLDATVAAGEQVRTGQVIGQIGADGAHLDWGAKMGAAYIDPMTLLWRWRLRLTADPA